MGACNTCCQEKTDKDVKIERFGPAAVSHANPDSSSPTFDLPAPHQEEAVAIEYKETRKPVQASQFHEPIQATWPSPPAETKPAASTNSSTTLIDLQTVQNTFRIILAKKAVRETEANQTDLPDPVDVQPESSFPAIGEDFQSRLTRECRSTLQSLRTYEFTFSVRGVTSYPACTLKDGSVYFGQWAAVGSGKYRKGKGRLYKADGSYQEGYWVGTRLHTHGRIIASNGDYYEGGIRNDLRNGDGVFRTYDQRTEYRGSWVNDLQQGTGTERRPDGSIYVGEFDRNERTGRGKLSMAEGKNYEGGFLNGKFNGKGVHSWKDGRRYDGDWMNGKMHGYGRFVYPDGKTYEGQYFDDKKNGKGVYRWEGKIYDGDWVDGKMHGIGWLTTEKGKKKYEFRNGERGKEIRDNNS